MHNCKRPAGLTFHALISEGAQHLELAGFLICENLLPVPGEIVLWYCGRAVRIDEDLK
jgi:hypothetical protein